MESGDGRLNVSLDNTNNDRNEVDGNDFQNINTRSFNSLNSVSFESEYKEDKSDHINERIKCESSSSFEEVFRDPGTFDFLFKIGNSEPFRDLRKESLYLKFDPCLHSPRDERISPKDEDLPIQKVFHNTSKLTLSQNDKQNSKLIDTQDEVESRDNTKSEHTQNQLLEFCDLVTLTERQTFPTTSGGLSDAGPDKLSIENITAMKQELRDLRDLVVKRELANRENLKSLEMILQQRCGPHGTQEAATPNEDHLFYETIMKEYEDFITTLVVEKQKAKTVFEERKKKLQGDLETVKEHQIITDKSYADLILKDQCIEKNITHLTEEISKLKQQLENFARIYKDQEEYVLVKEWETTAALSSIQKDIVCSKQKIKKEVSLAETRVKTLKLRESSLNTRLEQLTEEYKSLCLMVDEMMRKEGM